MLCCVSCYDVRHCTMYCMSLRSDLSVAAAAAALLLCCHYRTVLPLLLLLLACYIHRLPQQASTDCTTNTATLQSYAISVRTKPLSAFQPPCLRPVNEVGQETSSVVVPCALSDCPPAVLASLSSLSGLLVSLPHYCQCCLSDLSLLPCPLVMSASFPPPHVDTSDAGLRRSSAVSTKPASGLAAYWGRYMAEVGVLNSLLIFGPPAVLLRFLAVWPTVQFFACLRRYRPIGWLPG